MSTAQTPDNATAQMTLGMINEVLESIQLPKLQGNDLTSITQVESRENFRRAIAVARTNNNARIWIYNLMCRIGKINDPAAATAGREQGKGASSVPSGVSAANGGEVRRGAQSPREFQSRHVYGGKAAFCFEPSVTRGEPGVQTVSIESALATGPKVYDWSKKITIQLTEAELPQVLAVFLGIMPAVQFSNHGTSNDKGFSFEHQGDKIFAKMQAKDMGVRAMPILMPDAFWVGNMLMAQVLKNLPGADASSVTLMLRAMFGKRA